MNKKEQFSDKLSIKSFISENWKNIAVSVVTTILCRLLIG